MKRKQQWWTTTLVGELITPERLDEWADDPGAMVAVTDLRGVKFLPVSPVEALQLSHIGPLVLCDCDDGMLELGLDLDSDLVISPPLDQHGRWARAYLPLELRLLPARTGGQRIMRQEKFRQMIEVVETGRKAMERLGGELLHERIIEPVEGLGRYRLVADAGIGKRIARLTPEVARLVHIINFSTQFYFDRFFNPRFSFFERYTAPIAPDDRIEFKVDYADKVF